jgi:hypothetical protein
VLETATAAGKKTEKLEGSLQVIIAAGSAIETHPLMRARAGVAGAA